MIILYLALLASGIGLFVLSYVAPFRLAARLRQGYPQHWQAITESAHGKVSGFRTWILMQQVMRSPALSALGDKVIDRWRHVWRYSQWLGWLCWLAALAMRLLLH